MVIGRPHPLRIAETAAIMLALGLVPVSGAEPGATESRPSAPPPVFTWTGLYAGANFGHAWGSNSAIRLRSSSLVDLTAVGFGPASAIGASGVAKARLNGIFAGGQIGYNWQFAERFVVGVEADIQGAGVDGGGGLANVTAARVAPASAVTSALLRRNLEFIATLRGRFGYAVTPMLLLYATGGVAHGRARVGIELEQSLAPSDFDDAGIEGERYRNLTGFAVGGGLEAALGTNVSAKLEYLYYDLGTLRLGAPRIDPIAYSGAASTIDLLAVSRLSTRFNGHLLRAGLNYRFDWSRPQTSGSAATPVFAINEAAPAPEDANGDNPLQESPNNVSQQLAEVGARPASLLPFGPLSPFHDAWKPLDKRLQEELGLDLGLNYTSLYLNADRTLSLAQKIENDDRPFRPAQNEGASGDLDFFGRLRLNPPGARWPRAIAFATEWRHPFTLVPPGRLGNEIGSIWETADGFNKYAYSLTELYWEQGSREDGLMYRVGRMKPSNVWNRGRFVSSNHSFLNTTLSNTPAMALPGAGFGAAAAVALPENGYVLMGINDANSAWASSEVRERRARDITSSRSGAGIG
jgi:opacity protein-like surface antigen